MLGVWPHSLHKKLVKENVSGEEFSTSNGCSIRIVMKDGTEYMYDNVNILECATKIGGPGELPEYTFEFTTSDYDKNIAGYLLGSTTSSRRDLKANIRDVVFSGPATVVMWSDGTKTVVKCGDGDTVDHEKGLALAIAKKALGNKGNYYNVFREWLPEE